VPVPQADDFFLQGDRLIAAASPSQVDLRRAISNAYYGVFHAALAAAADEFVGSTRRAAVEYSLAYRRVDHRPFKNLCDSLKKSPLPPTSKYRDYEPTGGFGADLTAFSAGVVELHERRELADYDPMALFGLSDAQLALQTARNTVTHFRRSPANCRRTFLALLLFPPR